MNDATKMVLQSSLGTELLEDEADLLGNLMTVRDLADSEFLITEGMTDDSLHVLVKGKLEVVKSTGTGEFASLAVLQEGNLVGELSFIDGEPHTVGLRALCPSQVLCLTRRDFESIVADNPQLVYKMMRTVARSAHQIVHRMNFEFVELSNYIFKQHGRY
jgi:CRP/FNR family cyclic AMP-dependent transcriptional regulator